MTLRPSTASVGVILLLGLARTAHAQPLTPDNAPPAKRLEVCIAAFEEAQLKQRRGNLTNASKLYGECSSSHCPAQLRGDCARAREVVDRALPTASFVVRDEAGKELPAKIAVDGVAQDTSSGRAVPLDPGEHSVEYTLSDGRKATQKVVIHEGEKSRVVVLAPPPASAAPPPPAAPPATQPYAPPRSEPTSGPVVGPAVLASAGLLALIGSVSAFVLAADQESERDKISDLYRQSFTSSSDTALLNRYAAAIAENNDAAERNQTIGIIAGVTSALCLGGAAAWFFIGRSSAKSAWQVLPQLGPATAGASLGATF